MREKEFKNKAAIHPPNKLGGLLETKLIKLTRMEEWAVSFSVVLLGALLSESVKIQPLLTALAVFFLSASSFFIMNDYFDVEFDKLKKTNGNLISGGKVKMSRAISIAAAFMLLSLYIAYSMLPGTVFYLVAAAAAISFLYSAKPFRFKEKFLIDVITHGAMGSVVILIGYLLFAPFDTKILLFSVLMFIFSAVQAIYGEIRDYRYDKKSGFSNTVCTLGVRNAVLLVIFMYIISFVIFSIIVHLFFPFYMLVVLMPIFVYLKFLVESHASKALDEEKFIQRDKDLRYMIVIAFAIFGFYLAWINLT